MNTRINWYLLDALRFVLAAIVACHHLTYYFADVNPAMRFADDLGAKAAVLGFLLVSGFSIAASLHKSGRGGFYRRRLWRIYPIYLFALVATVILTLALGGVAHLPAGEPIQSDDVVRTTLGNLVFLQTFVVKALAFNGPTWSLAVEVSYYLVAPLMLRLPRWCVLVVIGVSAVSYSLPRHDDLGPIYFVFTRLNAIEYAWAWFMGYFLFANRSVVTTLGLAAVSCLLIVNNGVLNPEPYAAATFLACLGVVFLAVRPSRAGPASPAVVRLCRLLGGVSYPLYVLQFPVFIAGYAFLGVTNAAVLLLLCIAAATIAYYAIDGFVKGGLLRLLSRSVLKPA